MSNTRAQLFTDSMNIFEKMEIIRESFPKDFEELQAYKDVMKKENNLSTVEVKEIMTQQVNLWIQCKNWKDKDAYTLKKEEVEKEWFKHNRTVSYVRVFDGKYNFYKAKDAREFFKNVKMDREVNGKIKSVCFFDIWSEDPNIRTYEDIIFNPDPKFNDCRFLNNFDGFELDRIEPKGDIEENIKDFTKLIKHIFVDEIGFDYFMAWLNHIITKPHIKTDRAIVLYSEINGMGKNSIVDLCEKIISTKYVSKIENIEDLTRKFNANMENKFFIYGDEIKARARGLANELKSIITRKMMTLERKNQDPVYIPDYNNYIFTTNNEMAFKLDETDRRYFMVECPEQKLQKEDYDNFYKAMNDKNKLCSFFHYIKKIKPKYSINTENPPVNGYKKRIMSESIPAYYQIFYRSFYTIFDEDELTAVDFMERVKKFCKDNYLNQEFTLTKVGTALNKTFSEFCKTDNHKHRVYDFTDEIKLHKTLHGFNEDFYQLYLGDIDENVKEIIEKLKKAKPKVIKKSDLD